MNSPIDSRTFRNAMSHYASGLTIISGIASEKPIGFTCQSFYSVSVEPPLISFSVMRNSSSWPIIRETGIFSVNILAHAQQPIARKFGQSGVDRFEGVAWTQARSGNPIIDGSMMWLDCKLHDVHLAGDHEIVVGEVKGMHTVDMDAAHTPLLFFKGRFHGIEVSA